MSQYAKITDWIMEPSFVDDYYRMSQKVQNRVDVVLERIIEHGGFLPSMHVRSAFAEGYWMANVTQKRQAHRLLFWIDGTTMILERLLTHDERDDYLRV